MSIKINQQDLRAVKKKLKTIDNFHRWGKVPMEQSLSVLHDDVAKYTRKSPGAFSRLATPGQKRAYWAKVKSGEIRHGPAGYVRSGTLGRKWTTKIIRTMRGLIGELGNNTAYGEFVQGLRQQIFHAMSGWRRFDKVLAINRPKIERVWKRAIDMVLRK